MRYGVESDCLVQRERRQRDTEVAVSQRARFLHARLPTQTQRSILSMGGI